VTASALFDEAHSEAWTIRPQLADEMQPSHPGDASLQQAAQGLSERGFNAVANADGGLTEDRLRELTRTDKLAA